MRMSTPPAKFCSVPLKAMPTATPAEANTARNELVSMPIMVMARSRLSDMLTKLCRKVVKEGAISLLTDMICSALMAYFIRKRPIK